MYFGGKKMTAFGGFTSISPVGGVVYDKQQNLTDEQKEQARSNIGAVSEGVVLEIMSESEIFYGLLERISTLETKVQELENTPAEPSLITFTVDGKQYQAEQGMTWGQFVESEYNPVVVCSGCGEEKKTFWNKGTTIGGPIDGLCEDCDEMGGNVGDYQCLECMSPSDPIWAAYSYTIC